MRCRSARSSGNGIEAEMDRLVVVVVFCFQNDIWGLAAKFEADALYRFERMLADSDAALGGAGEGNHIDERMRGEGIADFSAAACDEVEDTFRESRLFKGIDEPVGRKRCMLAWLQDDGIAHQESRDDFLDDLAERVVPRSDAADDADWFSVCCGFCHFSTMGTVGARSM